MFSIKENGFGLWRCVSKYLHASRLTTTLNKKTTYAENSNKIRDNATVRNKNKARSDTAQCFTLTEVHEHSAKMSSSWGDSLPLDAPVISSSTVQYIGSLLPDLKIDQVTSPWPPARMAQ